MKTTFDRAFKIMSVFMVTFALLVGTHLGEFWPLSIYPMFSQAGKPWERALVREVSHDDLITINKWDSLTKLRELPGSAFSMTSYNLAQNDFANYLKKTDVWSENKQAAVIAMFGGLKPDANLILYKVSGAMNKSGQIEHEFVPMMVVQDMNLTLNPSLNIQGK